MNLYDDFMHADDPGYCTDTIQPAVTVTEIQRAEWYRAQCEQTGVTHEENGIRVSVKPDPAGHGFDFLVSVDGGPWEPEIVYPQIDALSIWVQAWEPEK